MFDQAVVAAAGGNGTLRAEGVGRPFKDGVAVVIKAANEARVASPGDAERVQQRGKVGKVGVAFGAEVVVQHWRAIKHGLHAGVFAVQDAQRVGGEAAAAVVIQCVDVVLQVGDECLLVGAAFVGKTDGVEFQR